MKLNEVTQNIVYALTHSTFGKDFSLSCDFVSKEFNQIDLQSVNKRGKSFTVLVLPHLPKTKGWKNEFTCWVNLKGFLKEEKLFGDNLKGGEK